MYYPITQDDIDRAIEKVRQRNLAKQASIVKEYFRPPKKHRKPKRKYTPPIDNIDKRMDYAIWKDKD
jgi:hypothetical protein